MVLTFGRIYAIIDSKKSTERIMEIKRDYYLNKLSPCKKFDRRQCRLLHPA